ncbi:hypothetical protein Avbf_06757, partial [Armadillidium vulgare]
EILEITDIHWDLDYRSAPHTRKVDFPVIFKTLSNITEELKSLFNSNIPILPVLGNHDTYPQLLKEILIHEI